MINYVVSNFLGFIVLLKFLSPYNDHELTVTLSAQESKLGARFIKKCLL